jgi:hypothetical protein
MLLNYNARLGGSNATLVAPSSNLDVVLDQRYNDGGVSLTLRHTIDKQVMKLAGSNDGVGAVVQGGSLDAGTRAYLSLQTPSGTGDRMVERLRVDDAGVSMAFLTPEVITNLVDSYEDVSIDRPPTANALQNAYISLSNLISMRAPDTQQHPAFSEVDVDALLPGLSGSNPTGSGGGSGSAHDVPRGLVLPPVLCSHLQILPGGWVDAPAFCNLIPSHTSTSAVLPPSANALRVAYSTLSNFCVFRTRAGASSTQPTAPLDEFQAGAWIPSTPDMAPRLRLEPSATTVFGGAPDSTPDGTAFRWVDTTQNVSLMRLQVVGAAGPTGPAHLHVGGTVSAASYCNLPVATSTSAGVSRLSSSTAALPATDASNVAASAAVAAALSRTVAALELRLRTAEGRLMAAGL